MYKKEEIYDSKIIEILKENYEVILEEIGEDPNLRSYQGLASNGRHRSSTKKSVHTFWKDC